MVLEMTYSLYQYPRTQLSNWHLSDEVSCMWHLWGADMRKLILSLCLIIVSPSSEAFTGNDALALMRDGVNSDQMLLFIAGFRSGVELGQGVVISPVMGTQGTGKAKICFPKGFSNQQYYDMAKKSLETNPEFNHQPFTFILGKIAITHFPCGK